jgi:Ca2+-binding RTX toxin-like protein
MCIVCQLLNDPAALADLLEPQGSGSSVVSDYTALLNGVSWWGQIVPGKSAIISYSFETATDPVTYSALSPSFLASFQPYSAADIALARQALSIWDAATGLTFVEAAPGLGDIRFGRYDFSLQPGREGFSGFAYYPAVTIDAGYANQNPIGGDVFMNTSFMNTATDRNKVGVLLHEIGHALGLKHPFSGTPTLGGGLDDKSQTVMSYTGAYPDFALGPLDIQAGQYLYGAPSTDGNFLSSWSWDAVTSTLTQIGLAGADLIRGVGGFNIMDGASGNDTLVGLDGHDTLIGGAGADQLYGGLGDDVFIVSTEDGVGDQISGGDGTDTIRIEGPYARFADLITGTAERLTGAATVLDLRGTAGNNYFDLASFFIDRPVRIDLGAGTNTGYGTIGNDTFVGGVGVDFLDGRGGFDSVDFLMRSTAIEIGQYLGGADLFARISPSLMTSLIGFEAFIATAHADRVVGTIFGNHIVGASGNDTVSGDAGNDTIVGGAGADSMIGGADFDILSYETTTTAMTVTLGAVWNITGSAERTGDVFSGFEGIRTGLGADSITGSITADWIEGFAGNDTLLGGNGNDTLLGGEGKDLFTGGGGLDKFIFTAQSETAVAFAGRDVINTFAHGDKIDLSAIDARTNVAGDQAFTFIGAAAFSGVSGQLRFDMTNISATGVKAYTVYGDVNGDSVADLSLQIYTAPTTDRTGQPQTWNLANWDFVL